MGLFDWLGSLFGGKGLAQQQQDLNALHQNLAAGNYQQSMAQGQAIANAAAAGGYGGPGAPGGAPPAVNPYASQEAQNALIQQGVAQNMADYQAQMNQVVAANPELMAPIEGVTIEKYAELAAQAASGMPTPQFEQVLAQHGMDRARYDRVAEGWNGRMSQDATATLMNIYGRAFGGSGAGQFGAAGAAGAAAIGATAAAGVAAPVAGAEPVAWEKYNEIGGAQRAWSASGKDVNAMLAQTFGISAADWSNMSQYWMAKLMTDPQKMVEMNSLQEQWAQRYAAPQADGDLQF